MGESRFRSTARRWGPSRSGPGERPTRLRAPRSSTGVRRSRQLIGFPDRAHRGDLVVRGPGLPRAARGFPPCASPDACHDRARVPPPGRRRGKARLDRPPPSPADGPARATIRRPAPGTGAGLPPEGTPRPAPCRPTDPAASAGVAPGLPRDRIVHGVRGRRPGQRLTGRRCHRRVVGSALGVPARRSAPAWWSWHEGEGAARRCPASCRSRCAQEADGHRQRLRRRGRCRGHQRARGDNASVDVRFGSPGDTADAEVSA